MNNDMIEIVRLIAMGEPEVRTYVTDYVDFKRNTFSFTQDGSKNMLTFPIGSFILSERMSRTELENLQKETEGKDEPKLTK